MGRGGCSKWKTPVLATVLFAVTRHLKEEQFKGGRVHSGWQRGAHTIMSGKTQQQEQGAAGHSAPVVRKQRVNGKWDQTKLQGWPPVTYFRLQDSAFWGFHNLPINQGLRFRCLRYGGHFLFQQPPQSRRHLSENRKEKQANTMYSSKASEEGGCCIRRWNICISGLHLSKVLWAVLTTVLCLVFQCEGSNPRPGPC